MDTANAMENTIQINAIVMVAAEKYDAQGLKLLAREKFKTACFSKQRDSMALAKAAQTIYQQIKLPVGDLENMKAILLWNWQEPKSRCKRFSDLVAQDAHGPELREMWKTNLDFLIDIQKAMFSNAKSWYVFQRAMFSNAKSWDEFAELLL